MRAAAILSAYKGAHRFLEGRVENLLEQSQVPLVVVVCQEESPEAQLLDEMQHEQLHNVFVLHTQDVPTIYAAWNQAIIYIMEQWPDVDYITNANVDDRLHPQAIQALTRALDESHASIGVAYPDVDVIDEGALDAFDVGLEFEKAQELKIGDYRWNEGGLGELLQGCFMGPMPMWRVALHKAHGLFDESYHSAGDYEWWLRLASEGVNFYHIKRVLGLYLYTGKGAEHREPLRSLWETNRARARYRPREGTQE